MCQEKVDSSGKNEARKLWLIILMMVLFLEGLLVILAFHRLGDRPFSQWHMFFPGKIFFGCGTVFVFTLVFFGWHWVSMCRIRFRDGMIVFSAGVLWILVPLFFAELGFRLIARQESNGLEYIGGTVLLPKEWKNVRTHAQNIYEGLLNPDGFFMYDENLGWKLRPDRIYGDQRAYSSAEGIRTVQSLKGRKVVRPGQIAMAGDSFVFGLGVSQEKSLPYLLSESTGAEIQNWGVPGYGIDQTHLRIIHDILPSKPRLVLFGVFSDDLGRSMNIYPFIRMPVQFSAKPRLIFDDSLQILTRAIRFSNVERWNSVTDLPFIERDESFIPYDWSSHTWEHYYVLRFLFSKFPPAIQGKSPSEILERELFLNLEILKESRRKTLETGAEWVGVLFPGGEDMVGGASSGRMLLERSGFPYIDLTPAVLEVEESRRKCDAFGHFTGECHARMAHLLKEKIPWPSAMERHP